MEAWKEEGCETHHGTAVPLLTPPPRAGSQLWQPPAVETVHWTGILSQLSPSHQASFLLFLLANVNEQF